MSSAARSVSISCGVEAVEGRVGGVEGLGHRLPIRPCQKSTSARGRTRTADTGRECGPCLLHLTSPERAGRAASPPGRRLQCATAPAAPMPVWRAHVLRVEAAAVDLGPRAAVQHREQPDADEGDASSRTAPGCRGERRRPLGVAERRFPHGRRQDDADDGADQAEEAADQRAARGQCPSRTSTSPAPGSCTRRDREGQADHEGDVLVLEHDAEDDRDDAEDQRSRSSRRGFRPARSPCPSR